MGKNKKGKKFNKQARSVGKVLGPCPSSPKSTEEIANPEHEGSGDRGSAATLPMLNAGEVLQDQSTNEMLDGPTLVKPPEVDSGRESPESGSTETEEETHIPSVVDVDADCQLQTSGKDLKVEADFVEYSQIKPDPNLREQSFVLKSDATAGSDISERVAPPEPSVKDSRAVLDSPAETPRPIEPQSEVTEGVKTPVTAGTEATSVKPEKRKLPRPPPLALSDRKHPLEFDWSFWYSDPWMPWESALAHVQDFSYIEDFWSLFNNLKAPSEVKYSYYLFKKGIRPEWEDPVNQLGGKWTLNHGDCSPDRLWQELALLFVGGAALDDMSSHVSGIYFARKKTFAMQVSVWLDTTDRAIVRRVADIIKSTLHTYLRCTIEMDFTAHTKNLQGSKKKAFRQPALFHSNRNLSSTY